MDTGVYNYENHCKFSDQTKEIAKLNAEIKELKGMKNWKSSDTLTLENYHLKKKEKNLESIIKIISEEKEEYKNRMEKIFKDTWTIITTKKKIARSELKAYRSNIHKAEVKAKRLRIKLNAIDEIYKTPTSLQWESGSSMCAQEISVPIQNSEKASEQESEHKVTTKQEIKRNKEQHYTQKCQDCINGKVIKKEGKNKRKRNNDRRNRQLEGIYTTKSGAPFCCRCFLTY